MKYTILPHEELSEQLVDMPGWSISHDHQSISKSYNFADYYQTIAFVNALAWIAHQVDHHPELLVTYKTCTVSFTTHATGGITGLDLQTARSVDKLM